MFKIYDLNLFFNGIRQEKDVNRTAIKNLLIYVRLFLYPESSHINFIR